MAWSAMPYPMASYNYIEIKPQYLEFECHQVAGLPEFGSQIQTLSV